MAAIRGMHVSPAKHSYAWLPRNVTTGQTDGRTDRLTPDKVIPMYSHASQATQKWLQTLNYMLFSPRKLKEKRKRSDTVLWQKSLYQQKCQSIGSIKNIRYTYPQVADLTVVTGCAVGLWWRHWTFKTATSNTVKEYHPFYDLNKEVFWNSYTF